MTQFILTVEGDHAKLTKNGQVVYESDIGTKPPTDPIKPPPVVIPTPPPRSTVNYSLYMGLTRAQAELQRLHERVPGWSWAEFEASGFMEPDGDFSGTPELSSDITPSSTPHRRELHKGDEHAFNVPTYPGERVTLTLLEVQGTPDSLHHTSYVTDERHRVLSNPKYHLRHGDHTFIAQEGTKSYLYITPTDSGPIGIQRP